MNRAVLGIDDRPAAFRLDAAHSGMGLRSQIAHAVAMRCLIEAVTGRDRADLDRLEQNIEAGITHVSSNSLKRSFHTGLGFSGKVRGLRILPLVSIAKASASDNLAVPASASSKARTAKGAQVRGDERSGHTISPSLTVGEVVNAGQ